MKVLLLFLSVYLAVLCNAASVDQSQYLEPGRTKPEDVVQLFGSENGLVTNTIASMGQKFKSLIDSIFGRRPGLTRSTRSVPETNIPKCETDFMLTLVDCVTEETKMADSKQQIGQKQLLDMLKRVEEESRVGVTGSDVPCILKAVTTFLVCCVTG